jgi:hypothetical protein
MSQRPCKDWQLEAVQSWAYQKQDHTEALLDRFAKSTA